MKRMPLSFGLILVMAFAACTQTPAPADTSEADAAAIRQAGDQWIASFNAGDADALGLTYTEDAVSLPPEGPPVVGREAIVQGLRDMFSQFAATQTATVDEVAVFGDVAMARGTWSTRQTPKAGGAEEVRSGKWMELQKRQADGSWKTWRWMWNLEPTGGAAGE
jgi:uncharacterized protein (TIGR02246 family)